ncbi:hypothetical protein BRD00_14565 [Halobacteriales archaeon QS_8_69_26]|nr:MAG: hypothetical protein BRD00_14565 [Halobacteriales archaeon QS_8_69_26]
MDGPPTGDRTMHIGIVGTGDVGTALATGFAAAGHDVVVGSRDPGTSRRRSKRSSTSGAG